MKVLHIITGLNQGGAESALFRLVKGFQKSDVINIIVSLTDEGEYGKYLLAEEIEVFTLNMPRRRITLNGIIKLWRIIKQENPNVVQTWMYHSDLIGGIVAKIAGVNKIIWGIVHFNLSKDITPISTRFVAKLCALLSAIIPDRIVSCSESSIEVHRKFGYSNKFIYVPLGFDLNLNFTPNKYRQDVRAQWNISDEDVVLGCVARWDPQKDHKNLIKAFSSVSIHYPEVKCVLIGPNMSPDNEELLAMINNIYGNGGNLFLSGQAENITSAMSALDIHILPSLGEAFPNVVAEAMGCGIPCVVTDVGDASSIVDITGWVVQPGNSEALAVAICKALELHKDPLLWQIRKDSCRNRIINNYSLNKMKSNYISVWSK